MGNLYTSLVEKKEKLSLIGLGYVGMPIAVAFAKKLDVKMKDRSKFKGENKPVQNITWLDAQAYCKALGGNLPTESQWEYAARAGGNDGFVWEALEKGKMSKPEILVGRFREFFETEGLPAENAESFNENR